MDTVQFWLHIRGLKPLLVFDFRVDEKFAGGKFREIPFGRNIIFAGGTFRAKSKFANIAKISSTRKIGVMYSIFRDERSLGIKKPPWFNVSCSSRDCSTIAFCRR